MSAAIQREVGHVCLGESGEEQGEVVARGLQRKADLGLDLLGIGWVGHNLGEAAWVCRPEIFPSLTLYLSLNGSNEVLGTDNSWDREAGSTSSVLTKGGRAQPSPGDSLNKGGGNQQRGAI